METLILGSASSKINEDVKIKVRFNTLISKIVIDICSKRRSLVAGVDFVYISSIIFHFQKHRYRYRIYLFIRSSLTIR